MSRGASALTGSTRATIGRIEFKIPTVSNRNIYTEGGTDRDNKLTQEMEMEMVDLDVDSGQPLCCGNTNP